MSKFCDICDNLLTPNFANDELNFRCMLCNLSYAPANEDSLRFERLKENDVMIFEKILNKAGDDPVTMKARVKCIKPKCKSQIVKQVRVGDEMKLYNICTVCGAKWLN